MKDAQRSYLKTDAPQTAFEVHRTSDQQTLRIYTTTLPTEIRFPTQMRDPQYRSPIVWRGLL